MPLKSTRSHPGLCDPLQLVAVPVAAAALLTYMSHHLTSREWYAETAAAVVAAPAYTRLARLVARAQPDLLPSVSALE